MYHMQSMFKWLHFALMYDKRDPYRAVASAISEKESEENNDNGDMYKIVNSFKVSNDMEDREIEEIFLQIKRYSRSKNRIILCIFLDFILEISNSTWNGFQDSAFSRSNHIGLLTTFIDIDSTILYLMTQYLNCKC